MSIMSLILRPVKYIIKLVASILSYSISLLTPFQKAVLQSGSDNSLSQHYTEILFNKLSQNGITNIHKGTYTSALSAAKRDTRVLIVYLHSPYNDNTDIFMNNVITNESFLSTIQNNNVLLWVGNVQESEPFQVSKVLGAYSYPFMAVIAQTRSQMRVIDRIQGIPLLNESESSAAQHFDRILKRSIQRVEPELAHLRQEKLEREQSRNIRDMQDEAYRASLLADQEKERMAELKRQELLKVEQEKREKVIEYEMRKERRVKYLEACRRSLQVVDEPDFKQDGVTRISIRMHNGDRIIRAFNHQDKLEVLYNFVLSREDIIQVEAEYDIIQSFPRKVFDDHSVTIKESGLVGGSVLVEERLWEEEEDDDDE